MGRPPLDKKQRQLPVALSEDLRAQLESLSAEAGHSIAEEIRRRIERTIKEDADPVTRELWDGLVNIAAKLREDYNAEWHASSKAREAFSAAMVQRLEAYAYLAEERQGADERLFTPSGPPKKIGRVREVEDRQRHFYPILGPAK
jgi:hypothetical protein